MTKVILATTTAILVATGGAFAGSDYYGSNGANQPAVTASTGNADTTVTASIRKPVEHYGIRSKSSMIQPESGQGIWGH